MSNSKPSAVIRAASVVLVGLLATFTLSACSERARWSEGTGPIKIVASTNVWGDIAHQISGDLATVTALIDNVNQDPHSFEASARDQLAVQEADIVIMNGGGYDDFVKQMVQADDTPAILINAYDASGDDDTRNEHIWYSASQVKDVGNVIFSALEAVDKNNVPTFESNLAEFEAQIKLILIRASEIARAWGRAKVFATEPLIHYLLQDTGMIDITPAEFREAIEEGRDVPPFAMVEAKAVIKQAKFVAVNSSTSTAQIDQVLSQATAPAFGFGELLPQDPDTGAYIGDYFQMMASALDAIEEGASQK
jgi:zinc/manganese transport system substrate-binding protein